jgi:hypothetical protein
LFEAASIGYQHRPHLFAADALIELVARVSSRLPRAACHGMCHVRIRDIRAWFPHEGACSDLRFI